GRRRRGPTFVVLARGRGDGRRGCLQASYLCHSVKSIPGICCQLAYRIGEDLQPQRERLEAHGGGQGHHLDDLLRRRPVIQRVVRVDPQPREVQVGRRGVEREIQELAHLRLEHAVAPRGARELQVGLQEVRGLPQR